MFLGSRSSYEELYRDLLTTKESKAEIERSRDEAVSRVRELELKYQDLLLEVKQLNVTDKNKLADLECQLKIKTYELDRCSILLAESEAKYKHVLAQKENLEKKVETLKDELLTSRSSSEKIICELKIQIQEKAARLEGYEKLETELDKMIVRAAQQSDPDEADRLLAMCEREAFIPLNSKQRLHQSLHLARRILELENQYSELKEDLFRERDLKQELQRELTATKASLTNLSRPTSELIQVILQRNLEIQRLQAKVSTLDADVLKYRELEQDLRCKLAQACSQEDEFQELKRMIGDLRSSHGDSPVRMTRKHRVSPAAAPPVTMPIKNVASSTEEPNKLFIHLKKPLSLSKVNEANLERRFMNLMRR